MTKAVDPFRVTKQLDPSVLGAIAHRLGTRGRHPSFAKLTAFAVSSYIVGVTGALWAFVYLGAWEPLAFDIERSFQLLFMVIIGGLGSILGSVTHLEFIIFGSLICFLLIKEPHGFARLWSVGKEKLRLWPYPY